MANIDVKPPTGPQANATVNQVNFKFFLFNNLIIIEIFIGFI